MRAWMITILSVLLLSACHDDKDDAPVKTERAVLVYMAADNDLSSFTVNDISEMMRGSKQLSKANRLLLFVDKRGQKPYMLEVSRGDTTRLMTFNEELKSSDAQTLQMAMQQMVKRYPTDSYGLVLWGHADGWIVKNTTAASRTARAYGADFTGGTTWMDIPDMAQALGTLPHLDFIFADCCAFQSVESAYELRDVTDYIIASAAEIPGEGAPYETVIPALFNSSDSFYKMAVDAYYNQTTYDGMKEPMSVVKTCEMEHLAEATRQALQSFVPLLDDPLRPDVSGLIYYYLHTLFDMNDFMLRHADSAVYQSWREAFDAAIIYSTYTDKWRANFVSWNDFKVTPERYGGMSMYVPQAGTGYREAIRNVIELQNKNIGRMQWYTAAGLDELGW